MIYYVQTLDVSHAPNVTFLPKTPRIDLRPVVEPKGSMYPYSIYLGLKGVRSYIGILGSKYILYRYMEPLGNNQGFEGFTRLEASPRHGP